MPAANKEEDEKRYLAEEIDICRENLQDPQVQRVAQKHGAVIIDGVWWLHRVHISDKETRKFFNSLLDTTIIRTINGKHQCD